MASNTSPIKSLKITPQAGNNRTLFVEWTHDNRIEDWQIDHYEIRWWYAIRLSNGQEKGLRDGDDRPVNTTRTTYSAPADATKVTCYVRPVSKTYKNQDKDTTYWEYRFSEDVKATHEFDTEPSLGSPSTPSVEIKDQTLTATVDNVPDGVTKVEFQVAKNNATKSSYSGTVQVKTNYASCEFTVATGATYKVRCRYINNKGSSEWSDWSGSKDTPPSAPSGFTKCKAETETSVTLTWKAVAGATSYDIEYTTEKRYFDTSNEVQAVNGVEGTRWEVTGLDVGDEYFFRLRAVNEGGTSAWSRISSVTIGTRPVAPTTWSSTTTAIVGEKVTLHWIHNAEDESAQTSAQIEMTVKRSDTDPGTTSTITRNTKDEPDDEKTMYFEISTSGYPEGAIIQWRVRTAGALLDANSKPAYGDWSILRTVDVYAKPSLSIVLTNLTGEEIDRLESLPLIVNGEASPTTQTPTGYHITITSNGFYETTDFLGEYKFVKEGDVIYSRYLNSSTDLEIALSAGDITLENGVSYTITCVVSMDSGLTAEASREFTVSFADEEFWPNAELSVDKTDISVSMRPYAKTPQGEEATNVTMSVYRQEFDGSFTMLTSGLDPTKGTHIIDPHPALDYARYRIVAVSTDTGAVSYYDLPPYPINEKAVIIQWDETWRDFLYSEDPQVDPTHSGSILKLPYNIDVSEDYSPDKSLIEYIGRNHPVSYYGTQQGVSASWSVVIPKTDTETIYALRRLAIWPGDVYVREPSGTGYWANVTVSFSQKHLDTTIPVKLDITRVSGGV